MLTNTVSYFQETQSTMKSSTSPTAVANMPNHDEKESTTKRAARKTKNAFQQMVGCFKKSDHLTKIKYKEHLITKRKKEFGVAYINLVQKKASEQELRLEKEGCLTDIDRLMKEIEDLEAKVEEVEVETRSKIRPESAFNTPAIEVTNA